jgi:hypothetical protein
MAHDVFISYAHEDRTVANAVVATLESRGIRCWISPRDILPGEDWGEAIIDAIQEAHALVLVFSSHSNESDQIKREVERAVHQGLAVIPLRIEDVLPSKTLEYFISTQHWLDALTPPLEDHLAHLADTITVLLAKKGFKDNALHAEGEEPAPSRPGRPPAVSPTEHQKGLTRRKKILLGIIVLVILIWVPLMIIGHNKHWFIKEQKYLVNLGQGYNLHIGSPVKILNMEVGKVTEMRISGVPGKYLAEVYIKVLAEYAHLIRLDSVAEVVNALPGGSVYLEISPGSRGYPITPEYGTIPSRVGKTMPPGQ